MNVVKNMTLPQIRLLQRYLATLEMEESNQLPRGAVFLSRGGGFVVTAFQSGKVLFQGKGCEALAEKVDAFLQGSTEQQPTLAFPIVGGDESGKGDIFGPLVLAAFAAHDEEERRSVVRAGARDCKLMTDEEVVIVGKRLERMGASSLLVLSPEEYNRRYAKVHNVNVLLNEGYARLLEGLADRVGACTVILDKYGNRALALWPDRKRFSFVVEPHAEHYPEVAAASVLARAAFLDGLHRVAQENGIDALPKGASFETQAFMRRLAEHRGKEILRSVAKVNFLPVRDCLDGLF